MKIRFVDSSVFQESIVKLALKPLYAGIKVLAVASIFDSADLMNKLKLTAGVMIVSFGQGACEIIKARIQKTGDNVDD